MIPTQKVLWKVAVWFGLLLGIALLGITPREDFTRTIILFTASFVLMCLYYQWTSGKKKSVLWWFVAGLILRFSLLFTIPQWSDDYARFLWDGELLLMGQNPYIETPYEWINANPELVDPFLEEVFEVMNSPDYYSVYPPSNQVIFGVGAFWGSQSLILGLGILRTLLIFGEIGVFILLVNLLRRVHADRKVILLYWFNPLVILELIGNLHFEGLVLVALLGALWAFCRQKYTISGAFWSMAIGIKILPLMLAPSLTFNEKLRKSIPFWLASGAVLFLAFGTLLIGDSWQNLMKSLQLYQGKFEFNASIYYLFREVGYWIKGYNTIAVLTKILGLLSVGLMIFISWKKKPESLMGMAEVWTMIYLVYLIFQPVIHPWYIIPAFGLSLLTRIRSLFFWSGTVFLSYEAYSNPDFKENPYLLFIEYLILGLVLIWDIKKGNIHLSKDKHQEYV